MGTPAENAKVVRIDLSPEQMQQLRAVVGVEVKAIELTIDELEQRIAPKIASNHNETFLVP